MIKDLCDRMIRFALFLRVFCVIGSILGSVMVFCLVLDKSNSTGQDHNKALVFLLVWFLIMAGLWFFCGAAIKHMKAHCP